MRVRHFLLLIITAGSHIIASAQTTCTTLGQNPSTAFPVCGNTVFSQSTVPLCGGRPVPPANCAGGGFTDINPFWYRFTCFTGGTLGFVITPISLADDYDWQVFDITGANPTDVYTNTSLFVACNWSGRMGVTGASSAGTSLINCAGSSYPLFSSMPTLIAGHEYILLVSNYSASQVGYQLAFTGGTAVITDPAVPLLENASAGCDRQSVGLGFSKRLKCSSIAPNGSDFVLSPSGTIATVTGIGCSSGFDFDSILVTFTAPLPAGAYTITLMSGTDGNTLLDNCDVGVAAGSSLPFTILAPGTIAMGIVAPVSCAPSSVVLNFADPILCNSIAGNGSDFIVTGPSAVTVTGAVASCNANGETTGITLQFAGPVIASGNYQVQAVTGSDGNTVFGRCNTPLPAGSTSGFTVQPRLPIPMGTVAQPSCSPSTIILNFNDNILCSSIAPNGTDFSITGPSAVAITSATAVCNTGGTTNSISIQLSSPITTSGNYQVLVGTGSDGNTLTDSCLRQVNTGANAAFVIPVATPSVMTGIAAVGCSPGVIRINLNQPVQCNSIAANGSDFIITGASPVTVMSATGICTNGLTNSIDVQVSPAIVVGGNYQVQLIAGSDGNTLLSDCNRLTPPGSTVSFTASDTVSARFTYQVQSTCATSDINFTNAGGNGINSWNWTVNANPASTLQSFTQTFPATSQQSVQLTVSNGVCTDTRSENIVLDNKVIVDFTLPDMICPEDSAVFTNLSTGPVSSWLWDFGNGQTSNAQSPPAQHYPLTGQQAFYNITLTASNSNGCRDTKTKQLKVLSTCLIAVPSAFTPNNDGLNDYLYPLNAFKATNLDFKVYNRWGQLIFETTDWTKKWNGKYQGVDQASGVYVWSLRYKDKDTGKEFSLKGTTMLIR